jgi:hypothetical protein
LIKKEEYCEKLEQEVVSLRKSLRNSQEEELKKLSSAKIINTSWMHGETSYKKIFKYQQEG